MLSPSVLREDCIIVEYNNNPMTLPCRQIERNGRVAPLPAYQTAGAAAMDVHAFLEEPVTIAPGGRALIPTGLCYTYEVQMYGPLVKRLRRRPLTAQTGVRFSYGS